MSASRLPVGYTNISVPSIKRADGITETNPSFSSGTWSTPAVNQATRTVDVQLTAGTGLVTYGAGRASM